MAEENQAHKQRFKIANQYIDHAEQLESQNFLEQAVDKYYEALKYEIPYEYRNRTTLKKD